MTTAPRPLERVNVLTAGDALVGKSCLVKRLCEGRFIARHVPTIGVDYGVKVVDVDGERVRANFFDLSGVDAHLEVRNEFYRDAHGVRRGAARHGVERALAVWETQCLVARVNVRARGFSAFAPAPRRAAPRLVERPRTPQLLLVFDVGSRTTFDHLDRWLRERQRHGATSDDHAPPIVVVGNKVRGRLSAQPCYGGRMYARA